MRYILIFFLFTALDLKAEFFLDLHQIEYIFCVDAGATKMSLQVLNSKGEVAELSKHNIYSEYLTVPSGNMYEEGAETIIYSISQLFEDLKVGGLHFSEILPKSHFLAGIAGIEAVGDPEVERVRRELEARGFLHSNISLVNDGILALEALGENGIIVIAGTGSICLGKKGSEIYRSGGARTCARK